MVCCILAVWGLGDSCNTTKEKPCSSELALTQFLILQNAGLSDENVRLYCTFLYIYYYFGKQNITILFLFK